MAMTLDTAERPKHDHYRPRDYRVHEFHYDDPFISDSFDEVNAVLAELAVQGMAHCGDHDGPDLTRTRRNEIDRTGNPATAALIERLPSFADWLDLVPTAAALDPLYDPSKKQFPNRKPIHPDLAEWLRNITDGRGIRSRGALVEKLLTDEALRYDGPVQFLSLASGAAQPIITTAKKLSHDHGVTPHMTLVDKDQGALDLAKDYAANAGLAGSLETMNMNILRIKGLTQSETGNRMHDFASTALSRALRQKHLPANQYHVVDAVGLVEYLGVDDWPYTYGNVIKTKTKLAGAKTFLKNAYELVRPGGVLVIGNMLDTHPQLAFTLDVIQWPHIKPRSIEEMVRIFDEAGLAGELDVYCPDDGAYAGYQLRKPEA